MRRPFAALLILVLLALLLLWALWPSPELSDAPVDLASPVAPSTAQIDTGPGGTAAAIAARRARRRNAAGAAGMTEESVDEEEPREPWTLRLVDPDGHPVPGLRVKLNNRDLYSSATGVVALGRHLADEELAVTCVGLEPEQRTITGAETTLTTPPALPLLVTVHNGETGADVPGARAFLEYAGDDVELQPTARGLETSVAPLFRLRRPWLRVRVEAPKGFSTDKSTQYFSTMPARYADGLHIPIALRPAVTGRVVVTDSAGKRVAGASVAKALSDGAGVASGDNVSDENGVLQVKGVPFYRDETLVLTIGKEARHAEVEAVQLGSADETFDVRVELPDETSLITISGFGGSGSGWVNLGQRPKIKAGRGRIELLVRRRNGEPASGARVRLQKRRSLSVNHRGHVVFEGLATAAYSVVLDEPGLVRNVMSVSVKDGETTHAELVEGPGASVLLRIRNEHGTRLPFARVTFHANRTTAVLPLLDEGMQVASFLTDAAGELRMQHLPTWYYTIKAVYGARQGTRIVLKAKPELEMVLRRRGDSR